MGRWARDLRLPTTHCSRRSLGITAGHMAFDQERFSGACHCGRVKFNVKLSDGLRSARRCDCSYCRMRGAVAVSATLADFEITAGKEAVAVYRFNSMAAKHYFCSTCGIYTHHQRRSNPGQYGVNVACLDGISPFDFEEVPVNDGVNHPSDGAAPSVSGYLRFVRSGKATSTGH